MTNMISFKGRLLIRFSPSITNDPTIPMHAYYTFMRWREFMQGQPRLVASIVTIWEVKPKTLMPQKQNKEFRYDNVFSSCSADMADESCVEGNDYGGKNEGVWLSPKNWMTSVSELTSEKKPPQPMMRQTEVEGDDVNKQSHINEAEDFDWKDEVWL